MSRVNVSTLNINIVASAQGVVQGTQAAGRAVQGLTHQINHGNRQITDSFGGFIGILKRVTLGYLAIKTVNAAINSVKFSADQLIDSARLAANAETAKISFEVLLGSANDANTVIKDLYKFVETTPFRLEELQRGTKLLAAFGFQTERIIPSLRAIGDVASATGADFVDLADVYGRTRVEQRLYTRDLNQFTSRGIPLIAEFAGQFGVAETQIRKMAEEGYLSFNDVERAFASMTSEGGRFFDLMERQSKTLEGQLSNLYDEVDALKREFGEGMVPAIAEFVKSLRESIGAIRSSEEAMMALRISGEEIGFLLTALSASMRLFAASASISAAALARFNAEVIDTVADVVMLYEAIQKGHFSGGMSTYLRALSNELRGTSSDLVGISGNLADLRVSLADAFSSDKAVKSSESLADALGRVSEESLRAKNQLRFIEQDSQGFADSFRSKYITPMQQFEAEVEKLTKANVFGDLKGSEFASFLAAETNRLNEAVGKLKEQMQDNPANIIGSREADAAIFRFQNQSPSAPGADVQETVRGIRERVQTQADKLRLDAAQAIESEALAKTSGAADQATNSLNEFAKKVGETSAIMSPTGEKSWWQNMGNPRTAGSTRFDTSMEGVSYTGPRPQAKPPLTAASAASSVPAIRQMGFLESTRAWVQGLKKATDNIVNPARGAAGAMRFDQTLNSNVAPGSPRAREIAAQAAAALSAPPPVREMGFVEGLKKSTDDFLENSRGAVRAMNFDQTLNTRPSRAEKQSEKSAEKISQDINKSSQLSLIELRKIASAVKNTGTRAAGDIRIIEYSA